MALTRTTSAAIVVTDTEVVLASIAGLQASNNIVIDGEVMRVLSVPVSATLPIGVLRGVRGTAAAAHPTGAIATFGPPAEFSAAGRTQLRDIYSVSANGAIANPTPGTDRVVFLNGVVALTTLTLTNPTKDADGDKLYIVSNGKAAHVVTYTTSGLGGGGATTDVLTFSAVAQMAVVLIAANELWVMVGSGSGAGSVAAGPVIT